MKYQKKFKIYDNPKKSYLRMKIIEDYLDWMSLTEISKKKKCTIKTVKLWADWYRENKKIKILISHPNPERENFQFLI